MAKVLHQFLRRTSNCLVQRLSGREKLLGQFVQLLSGVSLNLDADLFNGCVVVSDINRSQYDGGLVAAMFRFGKVSGESQSCRSYLLCRTRRACFVFIVACVDSHAYALATDVMRCLRANFCTVTDHVRNHIRHTQ